MPPTPRHPAIRHPQRKSESRKPLTTDTVRGWCYPRFRTLLYASVVRLPYHWMLEGSDSGV
jgi:hypothetical protein